MMEAVRLVRENGYSVAAAAKASGIPRMTLSNRLQKKDPMEDPKLGRPQELDKETEEAIVKCLTSSVVWLFFKTFAAHKGSACASPI